MPTRGTPSLWWVRILTDFGKDEYVLATLAVLLIVIAIAAPALRGIQRSLLLGLGTRLQFLFFAVLVSVARRRSDQMERSAAAARSSAARAMSFHFSHFAGTQAYSSFPSGHAITAFALAFAVAAVWPRARGAMIVYAARHRGDASGAAGPSSQRRGRRRAGRRRRRDVRALLVRGPKARICDPSRRHDCAAGGTLVRTPQKGCPGRFRPIKAVARTRLIEPVPALFQPLCSFNPTQDDECRFAFFRQSTGRRFHRCARAQRSGQCRAADRGNHCRARRPLGLRNHLRQ